MWGHDSCRLAKAARYAQDVWSATTQSSLAVQAPRPCTHCWEHLFQLTVVYITHWLRSTMQDQQVGHNRNTMIFFYTHKVNLMNYSASLSELQVVFCHSSQSVRVRVVWNPFPQSVLLISPAITACQTGLNLYNPSDAPGKASQEPTEHCFWKPEASETSTEVSPSFWIHSEGEMIMSHFALCFPLPSSTTFSYGSTFSCESQICNLLPPVMKPHTGHLYISHPGSDTL